MATRNPPQTTTLKSHFKSFLRAVEEAPKQAKERIETECERRVEEADAKARTERAGVEEEYERRVQQAEDFRKIEMAKIMDECRGPQSRAYKWQGLELQKLYSRRKIAMREASEAWQNDRDAAGMDRADAVVLFFIEKRDLRKILNNHHVVFIPVNALPVIYTFVNDLIKMVKRFDLESLQADMRGWYIEFGGSEQSKKCASACFDYLKVRKFNHYQLKLELIGRGFSVIKSWPQEAPSIPRKVSQTSSPDPESASNSVVASPTTRMPTFEIDMKDPQILKEFKEFLNSKYPERYGNHRLEEEEGGESEVSEVDVDKKKKPAKSEDDDVVKGPSMNSKGTKLAVIRHLHETIDLTEDSD
ncbi:uncharacterized protein PAC_04961 [Phialocephala subalpina]|uniref:Histone lysine methyltransferase SET associated domain-containing protein n=1 Tax=Phialocephala subalpina TaxID=576137 RepID=A0A1L7WQN2_9HELO|nr:uncharacterized protein PAC_04961 [Phialocephala subalpina]